MCRRYFQKGDPAGGKDLCLASLRRIPLKDEFLPAGVFWVIAGDLSGGFYGLHSREKSREEIVEEKIAAVRGGDERENGHE